MLISFCILLHTLIIDKTGMYPTLPQCQEDWLHQTDKLLGDTKNRPYSFKKLSST